MTVLQLALSSIVGILAVGAIGFVALVLRRSLILRNLAATISADSIEPILDAQVLVSAPARHELTFFEHGGVRIPVRGLPRRVEGIVVVTTADVVLRATADATTVLVLVPLPRVIEPVLLASFEGLTRATDGGILRVDWLRGGQRLSSVFVIEGAHRAAEQVRREIHLRAGNAQFPGVSPPGPS